MSQSREQKNIKNIQRKIDASALPPHSDFVLPGYNTILCSKNSDFINDFKKLQQHYNFTLIRFNLNVYEWDKKTLKDSPWARDFIASKNLNEVYVLRENGSWIYGPPDLLNQNINVSSFISRNKEYPCKFNRKIFQSQPSNIVLAGGNIFHCVNSLGNSFTIVGEMALTSQFSVSVDPSKIAEIQKRNINIGAHSLEKYAQVESYNLSKELADKRALRKQILKDQLGQETTLVIVPSVLWHIDTQMAFLPNGVVIIHSFKKTLDLLEKYKNEIPDYKNLYAVTQQLELKLQALFDETKRKLEKRNFIVKEVCGFITTEARIDDTQNFIATCLNSIVGVDREGNIFYSLLPDNPAWYLEYIKKKLYAYGVETIFFSSHPEGLKFLREQNGSIRCQYNTVAKQSLLFKQKKRKSDNENLPKEKKQKLNHEENETLAVTLASMHP